MELELFKKATADFDKAIQLESNHTQAYYYRGVVKYESGLIEESIADLDEAIRIVPDSFPAYASRALANIDLGRVPESFSDFAKALKLSKAAMGEDIDIESEIEIFEQMSKLFPPNKT